MKSFAFLIFIHCIQRTQKSKIHFEIVEGESAMIERGGVSMKIFAKSDHVIITSATSKTESVSYKYEIDTMPKTYHKLYWGLSKMIHKLRKKTIKYKIIRKRELDKLDRTICLVSLSGAYTVHFKNGTMAYLSNKTSDIKFIQSNSTKTLPFKYRDSIKAVHYNDAYDTLRSIVHELIRCADTVSKQRVKQSDYAKTWTVSWNADTGSVEDIKEALENDSRGKGDEDGFEYKQYEGLFKCKYESETTLSSDYNSTNSELSQCDDPIHSIPSSKVLRDDENKSISTVNEASYSYSSATSIKSEASWRNKKVQNKHQPSNGSYGTLSSIESIREDEDSDIRSLYQAAENEKKRKMDDKENKNSLSLLAWSKRDVCIWLLKQNNFSKDVGMIFWNYDIDGKELLKLSSNSLCHMFENINTVTNEEKKELIICIARLQSIHVLNKSQTKTSQFRLS